MALKRKHKRLVFVALGLLILAAAAALMLTAFRDNIVFFNSPSEILAKPPAPERRLRIGGLVEEGSVAKEADGITVTFRVTDTVNAVPVRFKGVLPDLFREGQGVVAEGRYVNGVFAATDVLAKHDENYMPPEVADALKKSGQWQHMEKAMKDAGQIKGAPGK